MGYRRDSIRQAFYPDGFFSNLRQGREDNSQADRDSEKQDSRQLSLVTSYSLYWRFTRITAIRMPPVLDWLLWIFARIFATIGKLPAILPNSQNEDGRSPSSSHGSWPADLVESRRQRSSPRGWTVRTGKSTSRP